MLLRSLSAVGTNVLEAVAVGQQDHPTLTATLATWPDTLPAPQAPAPSCPRGTPPPPHATSTYKRAAAEEQGGQNV